jgi:ABC-type nitrate/sulfonate/bicarbonate transport system substrate-binding protein
VTSTFCRFKIALLLGLLASLARTDLSVATEARKVTLSYSAVSMTWFPVKVAVEKGFFRNEGLEPELIHMNGNVPVSVAYDTTLLREVQRDLGMQ